MIARLIRWIRDYAQTAFDSYGDPWEQYYRWQRRREESRLAIKALEDAETKREEELWRALDVITDDHGNYWGKWCQRCGGEKEIVRPGKAQCSKCGH